MSKANGRSLGATMLARTEYRYGLVLVLLLATFVLLMAGSTSEWARIASVALTGATLVAALFAARCSARLRRLAVLASIVALLTAVAILVLGRSAEGASVGVLNAGLVALAPIVIARSAMRRRTIDLQTILAALCVYVLLGMLWAFTYGALAHIGKGPFFAQSATPTSADFLYFSFITQTTVGYGDLSAAGNLGRACAVIEALIGQIYLVTVVSLIVSNLGRRGAPRS